LRRDLGQFDQGLSESGYRVIAPDQIGFCTSSKPDNYQYSFQQLATNTQQLLKALGIQKATLLGHSTGGMLATRYALLFPEQVDQLALVNPIGLEDWKALGVPYRTVDQWYQRELKVTAQGIRDYERTTYYDGRWKPEFDRWVDMLAGLSNGPGKTQVAWNSALIYDMIFTQPVYYEFKDSEDADAAADRHLRHHRHRQGHRATRGESENRPLRSARQTSGKADPAVHAGGIPRHGPRAANGRAGAIPQSVARLAE
jgi:pimeloyl-ACP methyl ester carboxylesterase